MMQPVFALFNYGAALCLLVFGIYVVIAEKNLIRKVIGINLLQTGVILFYITLSYKGHSVLPIVPETHGHEIIDVMRYANPLPHALMLTAIVVGVATLGVALTLIVSIYRSYNTLEEDEILKGGKKS